MFVSPFINHSNSWIIDFRCTFLVVRSGNPFCRLIRICRPNTLNVPVPVLSFLDSPLLRTSFNSSKYCFIVIKYYYKPKVN